MWKFESYNTEFIKDISNILYIYKDFQFRLNHIEEEKKVVVKVFYKEKYVDCFSYEYEKDNFSLEEDKILNKELEEIVNFFYKQGFIFIQKKIIQTGTNNYESLWFFCYNKYLKKTFSTEMKYQILGHRWYMKHKIWWLYLHEIKNDWFNYRNQYFVSVHWIEEILYLDWIKSFWWKDLLSQIKQLKQINEKGLYTIYQNKNLSWHRLFWTVIIFIKELLEFTKIFFWNDYEVDFWEISKNKYGEVDKNLATNFILYLTVTKKNNSFLWIGNIFKTYKFKDYQKKVLEKFPQLLKIQFSKNKNSENIDLEKKCCLFNIRVKENWEVVNLRDIEDVLYYEDNYNIGSIGAKQPMFLTSYIDNDSSFFRSFQTNIISSKKIDKFEELEIYYNTFSEKDNFIRKRAKYFLENKDEEIIEKNIVLYQIDIINRKYGKWNYIISYKLNEYIKFLREDWEILYSLSKEDWFFDKETEYNTIFFSVLNTENWILCLQLSENYYILVDLIHLNHSIISFSSSKSWEAEAFLINTWDKGYVYNYTSKNCSLFRLTKDCMRENFQYNIKKLPLWINDSYRNTLFLFYKWVKGVFNIKKKQNLVDSKSNINIDYYNFLSNNKPDIYTHIYHFLKNRISEDLMREDKIIIKDNEKLWILTSWNYPSYSF